MLTMVATPIGNLGDISQRALAALEAADVVVSEDTRKTGFLLNHFEIKKPQLSFREDNEDRALPRVMEFLELGKNVVLVTDAGTPSISDPGFTLVRSALENGIPVSAIPGPTALIMALVLSGLPVHSFTFRGFPPRKSAGRRGYTVDLRSRLYAGAQRARKRYTSISDPWSDGIDHGAGAFRVAGAQLHLPWVSAT